MPTREELMQEAKRRGMLSDRKEQLWEEAKKRGLLAQDVDTSPIDLPEKTRMIGGKDPMPYTFQAPGSELAKEGYDVTTGAPVGRTQAAFAQNEAIAIEYLSERLSNYFETPVRVTKTENGLEYINPRTNRKTLVDEADLSGQDFGEIIAPALPVIGAIGGSIVGGLKGMPNLGAGIGGGFGEAVRRGIGHLLGVREGSIDEESRGVAGVAAAEVIFSKAGEQVFRLGNRIRSFFKPNVLEPEAAAALLMAARQDQAISEEIARRTGKPFQPFTGQVANDPLLLGHQSTLKTDPETAIRFREQQKQNDTTLEFFYDELNPTDEVPASVVGRSIQAEARDQTKPRIGAVRDSVDQAVEDLETITRALPDKENSAIVNEATAAAAVARRIIKDEEDRLYNQYKAAIGLNEDTALSGYRVPVTGELRTTLNRLKAEAKQAIDTESGSAKFRLAPESFDNGEVDLWQLNLYIGDLKRRLRAKGQTYLDPQGRDVERMITAAQNQRNEFLRKTNPEALGMILEAEQVAAKRANLFDKGLVNQLLRKEQGEWTITDASLVGTVIGSGDKEAMEHLVTAFGYDPAGVPTLQRSFLAHYKNEVVVDGVPQGNLHRRFMDRHKDAINVLFPGDRRLMQLGEFEKAVTAKLKRFKQFETAVEKTFRGKIQNISPEHVANKIFTDRFSEKEVSYLMQLAKAAGVEEQYKLAITGNISRQFRSRASGINFKTLDDFLSKNKSKIIATMGGRYYKDMELLVDALEIARRTETGISTTARPSLLTTIAEGVARSTVARPLSPHGVALTRSQNFYQRAKNRMWQEIVENPDKLRVIIANSKIDARTEEASRILGIVGGEYLYGETSDAIIDFYEQAQDE